MSSHELIHRTRNTGIRYAQCWEDADILVQALDIQPGQTCLSIASAGDNTLALLTRQPGRVIAVDMNAAQIAALELRVAAYRVLRHGELLELLGVVPSNQRVDLYARCRRQLQPEARAFWDARTEQIAVGIARVGRFEQYLNLFRQWFLPLVHSGEKIARLLEARSREEREQFFEQEWNNHRWRGVLRLLSARWLLQRLGRDAAFFAYAQERISQHIEQRTRHVLTALDPARNPYVELLLTGEQRRSLPLALRPEQFEPIRDNLHRLEWHTAPLEQVLQGERAGSIHAFNLSDVFEYLSPASTQQMLGTIAAAAAPDARLAYWNMVVPRSGHGLRFGSRQIVALPQQADALYAQDQVPFYSRFVVEQVQEEVAV
ncbi:MAG: DUF3419 family protein [Chloroflexaceae bacterium]|nr:DUF3419 family protein [Chloroflexaceae bacterium]